MDIRSLPGSVPGPAPLPASPAPPANGASASLGLAAALHGLEPRQERVELRTDLPGEGDWLRCTDLLGDPALFLRWRKLLGEWLLAEHGSAPERTTAGYVMTWYLHVPAYLGALLLHHERRVPMLRPGELGFRLGADRPHPDGMALLGREFYCLPDDPGSVLPEARVVVCERELAAALRSRFVAHAARFVRAYRTVSPMRPRMLWAAATDALENCLWLAGRQGGDEGAGVADAALVLDAHYPPLTSASTMRLATDGPAGQERGWTRRRESCCFSYLLPGESECESCPRTCPRG